MAEVYEVVRVDAKMTNIPVLITLQWFTMNFLLNLITTLFKYDTICLKVCCTCTIKQIYRLQLDLEMQSRDALCVLVKKIRVKNLPTKSADLHNNISK